MRTATIHELKQELQSVPQARLLELELEGRIVRLPGALFQRFVAA